MSTPSLRDALRKRYSMPEWVLMEEVRDAAGWYRHVDVAKPRARDQRL